METMKVCNTDDLAYLIHAAKRHNLNRQASVGFIKELDPNGNHVLSLMLYGHNMDVPGTLLHHRVQVLCKVKGEIMPMTLMLDVLDSDWGRLPSVEAAKARLGGDS